MTDRPPPPEIPDLVTVDIPVGGRVLVLSDLHLTKDPSGGQTAALTEVAQSIDAWTGPGAIVFNGNLLDAPGPAGRAAAGADILAAHGRLVASVRTFAGGAGRRVFALPGARDPHLAWLPAAQQTLNTQMGAEIALTLELRIETGAGMRSVRVEPGHRFDPQAAFVDPRNRGESPLSQHLRDQVVAPPLDTGGRAPSASWLAGTDRLADPAAFADLVVSRLTYRRLGRRAWLLLVPVVLALVLRLPVLAARHAASLGGDRWRVTLLLAATLAELLVLAGLGFAAVRGTWRGLAALTPGGAPADTNEAARAAARDLVTGGSTGLITGHTCRAELTHLGAGFYANAGASTEIVDRCDARLPGLGLPPVFLTHREVAWVELEAGNELHVRLFHGRQDLPGNSLLERAVARRGPDGGAAKELHPDVVATFPQGGSWPAPPVSDQHRRRVRRLAATFVALIGFLSLFSALSDPLRDRLTDLRQFVPLLVPETAAALTALASLALLMLARGIRRGQRRAWLVCQGLLLATFVLHLIKGFDVEEAIITLAVAGFLWVQRREFEAATDVPPVRRSILLVIGAAVATVLAGTLGLQVGHWVTSTRHHHRIPRLSWSRALQASVERMVGVKHVALPSDIDRFFSPAMAAATAGLVVFALVLAFRPVVARRRRTTDTGGLERARAIMGRHGSGTLDYFALRPDKEFFFWGDTVVAHATYSGVCLVSPDPIGPVSERTEAWKAFRAYVDGQGWALAGLGAGEEWLPIYRASGMHDLYVGDEGVVRVGRFTLEGGRFKGLRQAVNRVAKHGYTISFHDPSRIDGDLRAALEDVMTKSRRGDVERGFSMTLGRVFDPADEGLLLAVVHGPPPDGSAAGTVGAPVAFCQYVPAPGIGGYSLDLMRRDAGEHPNGLIDFAVVETIRHLAANGGEGLGLNFATMRAVLAGETGEGLSQRVQAWLLRRMGDSMQIESLWRFNAKFEPDWQPRYAIYDSPEHAVAAAIAVARAESFWELPFIGRFLTPSPERATAVAGARANGATVNGRSAPAEEPAPLEAPR